MQTTEQALIKNLPKQSKPAQNGLKFQANAIDKWFDTLPLANIRVSTKTIYKTLKDSNLQQIPYKKRLYFLEKIHETIVELSANLRKLNLNRELPLDEKHARIATLVQKLHKQIILGYLYVLKDLINCRLFFLCPNRRKTKALVIERMMRHHSLALIAEYQLYNTPQKNHWKEIHHLFLIAYKAKLLNKKIGDPSLQSSDEITIKNAYLQILLVSIADPFRMAQHHIYSIFRQLEEWALLADISPYKRDSDKNALVIDLSNDSLPAFIAPQDIKETKDLWTIDTSKLDYAHLIEQFHGQEIQTTEINIEFLKQLSLSWGIAPTRQHSRRPAKSQLKVAIGLNNVHYVLNGYTTPHWLQDEAPYKGEDLILSENLPAHNFSSRTIESTIKVSDIWGEVFQSKAASNNIGNNDLDLNEAHSNTKKAPKDWSMVNESIGGYCLLWDHNSSINAKVGEIIAISYGSGQKEGYWFVGTIRWVRCIKTNRIQIGVQIIAPNAIAIGTAKYVSMQEGMKSRAIMLPAIPILKQPKTIITTALGYEARDQVILDEYRLVNANITSVETKVVLLDTLEISSHFSRFKYCLAEDYYGTNQKQSSDHNDKETLSLDSDTEFDSIWDDL